MEKGESMYGGSREDRKCGWMEKNRREKERRHGKSKTGIGRMWLCH